MSGVLINRIKGERSDNLERAITACQLALQVFTRDAFPEKWTLIQNNLVYTYNSRIRGDRTENLQQAITASRKALQIYTYDAYPEQWAMTQLNLANSYWYGKRSENIEQAIAAYELALQVYTRDTYPEQWAMVQSNLANAYNNRTQGDISENLEQAIMAYELALKVRTREAYPEQWAETQNNLANAYYKRIQGDRSQNIHRSTTAYELALQVYTCNTFPKNCRQTAQELGNLYFEQKAWSTAANTYDIALRAAEILYQACIFLDGRTAELAEVGDLCHRAAYTLARIGDLQQAVEVLEQGRARGLSEILDRNRTNLNQLQSTHHNLYEQYREVSNQLVTLESQQRDRMVSVKSNDITPEVLRQTTTNLHEQLQDTVEQIRQVSSYEDFLKPSAFEDVQQAAKEDRPLLYLVATPNGSLALTIVAETIELLWLDDLTQESLTVDQLIPAWLHAYGQSHTDYQSWLNKIDTITRQLWDLLMGPIVQHLKTLGYDRATLIPTGFLSFLPLHAAWVEDPTTPTGKRYAFDDIHFTYAPNARSLSAAQDIAQQTGVDSMLAIENPIGDLALAHIPTAAAMSAFPQHQVLKHGEASIDGIRQALTNLGLTH